MLVELSIISRIACPAAWYPYAAGSVDTTISELHCWLVPPERDTYKSDQLVLCRQLLCCVVPCSVLLYPRVTLVDAWTVVLTYQDTIWNFQYFHNGWRICFAQLWLSHDIAVVCLRFRRIPTY